MMSDSEYKLVSLHLTDAYKILSTNAERGKQTREEALAKTKLEECIMWLDRGIDAQHERTMRETRNER